MSAWDNLDILPKEVDSFLENHKCPICQSFMVTNTKDGCAAMKLRDKEFAVWTHCKNDTDHYTINIAWQDPKDIFISDEEITFYDDCREYKLMKIYDDMPVGSIHFCARISLLDECGSPIDPEKLITLEIKNNVFDFNNFNAEKFASLIKTLIVFK